VKVLVSTAYLPPVEYISLFSGTDQILIESEENYLKQSYRNRCYILSAHGPQILTVPVFLGSLHKTHIKDIRIDYSKRWQQVHLGALTASYNASPYFQFYFSEFEKIISAKNNFLIDLNTKLTEAILKMLRMKIEVAFTAEYQAEGSAENDYRYKISPKKESSYTCKKYLQVFDSGEGFVNRLSIVDLIFNTGPEAASYL